MTRRGLVLGAGGALGASWMVGALAALQTELGWDARTANGVVGTSAGAVVAAMLAGGVEVEALLDSQRGLQTDAVPFEYDYEAERARPPLPRLRVGSPPLVLRSALRPWQVPPLTTISAWMLEGRGNLDHIESVVDQVVPRGAWPATPSTRIAAMDFDSGARVMFGAGGAPPAEFSAAVKASCAIPGWYAPVSIAGRRYVDGGTFSRTNLDAVAGSGHDVVYLLAPMAFLGRRPSSATGRFEHLVRSVVNRRVRKEADVVRRAGTQVVVLAPGPEDLEAMGTNVMDPRRRQRVLDTSLRTSAAAIRIAVSDGLGDRLMRVYLPSTFAGLSDLQAAGEIGPAPLHGHAVTPALRESYAVGDTDELEHVAQLAASSDSISLLHEDISVPRRRVVIAVEVPDASVAAADGGDESSVTVSAIVSMDAVHAFLVDDPGAADVIDRAAEAWPAAQTGEDQALFDQDEASAHDLMWFARQELDDLLASGR